ncbi:N-acetyltransferase ESCO2 [Podarcis raffonei]|uniref:N-acetyltransferase ESCO2 n=1 Tax=Podarcis raffonei TaxID=65483 RepID=UPI00232916F8|nr:N-acetyltransferase ESCO2 [Podarcis raffonei]XP_053239839.1 N-acetyltransferase ESCO2 [Podarcis raffonei]
MAFVTPRKRKRSIDSLLLVHRNPAKKLMMEFVEDLPVTDPARHHTVSQMLSFQDEEKENQNLSQASRISQKLDKSPLQTANVPKGIQKEFPQRTSPECGAAYSSIVPPSSFYNKGKQYLNLLERKLANESHPLNPRNDDGNLPVANKTETTQPKVMTNRSRTSKASKRPAASRQAKALPRNTKKAKVEVVLPKPVEGNKDANCAIQNKVETPFKVLSMKFKPVPKLQTGAAFFATGKKWQPGSKKILSSPSSPCSVSKPTVKERQGSHLAHSKLYLSTESKATEAGRKESPKEKKHDRVEDGVKLICNTGQETVCEVNLLQDANPVQTSLSGCSETLVEKETDAGTQDPEEILQGSPKSVDKHETASSSELSSTIIKDIKPSSASDTHPFFSTPSSNKKRPHSLSDEQSSAVAFSPVGQKVPTILRTSKKTKELSKDQMIIDAGQKHFGATVCKSCGMVYSAASPEDETQHAQYHQRFLEGIKYVSWKNEHVAAEFWDGKIVLILQDDPKYAIKKAEAVRELVDNELGFKQVVLRCPTQTYLFVSTEKKIVGCLIAEPVRQAYQVLSEPPPVSGSPTNDSLEPQRAWCCSTKPEKVFCGISRIWVFSLMRRRGIASRLVDVMRRTFLFGSFLNTNEIAFSDPTPDGKLFAARYCQTPNFLVYNFIN